MIDSKSSTVKALIEQVNIFKALNMQKNVCKSSHCHLNFLIEYEDNEYDFRCANADINSMKKIEFVFISSNSKSLDIKVNCEHIFQDYPIYLDKSMSRLTSI